MILDYCFYKLSNFFDILKLLKQFFSNKEDEFGVREKAGNTSDQDKDWNEYQPISSCGTLDIALNYLFSDKKLQITILEAKDLPSKDRGGASVVQVS